MQYHKTKYNIQLTYRKHHKKSKSAAYIVATQNPFCPYAQGDGHRRRIHDGRRAAAGHRRRRRPRADAGKMMSMGHPGRRPPSPDPRRRRAAAGHRRRRRPRADAGKMLSRPFCPAAHPTGYRPTSTDRRRPTHRRQGDRMTPGRRPQSPDPRRPTCCSWAPTPAADDGRRREDMGAWATQGDGHRRRIHDGRRAAAGHRRRRRPATGR